MNEETEIWGELTEAEYTLALKEFTRQFGRPKQSRRLALQADDFSRHDLDTRIRIGKGAVELVQKVGLWSAKTRTEISVPLKLGAEQVLHLYTLIINQLPDHNRQTNIIQFTNQIFAQPEFEVKLGIQTGRETVYHYEIEARNPNFELETHRKKLGLPAPNLTDDEAFWSAWNERVNLTYEDLTEDELIELIRKYMKVE